MRIADKYLTMMVMAGNAGKNVMLFQDANCGLTTLDIEFTKTESQ